MSAEGQRRNERRLSDLESTTVSFRLGRVQSIALTDVNGDPIDNGLKISLGDAPVSDTIGARRLASYANPVQGDIIAVLVWGNDFLVLGKIV